MPSTNATIDQSSSRRALLAVFHDLTDEQADGLACIVDNADFTTTGIPNVPVGYSVTRSQVFACAQPCAPLVGYRSPAVGRVHSGSEPPEGGNLRLPPPQPQVASASTSTEAADVR